MERPNKATTLTHVTGIGCITIRFDDSGVCTGEHNLLILLFFYFKTVWVISYIKDFRGKCYTCLKVNFTIVIVKLASNYYSLYTCSAVKIHGISAVGFYLQLRLMPITGAYTQMRHHIISWVSSAF